MSDLPAPSEPTDPTDAVEPETAAPASVLVDPSPVDAADPTLPEVTEPAPAFTAEAPPLTPPLTPPVTPTAPPPVPPADAMGPPPWPTTTPAPGGPAGPPPVPPAAPQRRPGPWKQFVAGALIGALVGGATAGGVYLATNDDTASRTVIVRQGTASSRNTSAIVEAKDIQSILAKVEPAVVAIRTGGAIDGVNSSSGGAGTGFVISADGVIVTNNHVVEGADEIEVAFTDGSSKSAKVLGLSAENDLAVLKVDATDLPVAKLGSSDSLQVGDEVIAIGNALALEGGLSVTRGIISAKDRTVPEESGATLYGVLQTDAAINPGNSGGPLVNSEGEVVGINTAIADPQEAQNVGFAMSIDAVKSVIEDLRAGKEVKTAFLGVVTQAVTPAIAEELKLTTQTGAVVRRITEGAAADEAGLKTDDVILAIDSKEVGSPDDLGAEVRRLEPGQKVDVLIERGGSQETISVTLGTRPAENG